METTQQTETRKRPRVFYGWYIVGASIIFNSYLSIAFHQGFSVLFLPILESFGWTRTQLSGAFSLRQLESGFLTPFIGMLVDKIGARKVILGSVILTGTGLMLVSMAQNLWQFYLTFIIAAAGVGGASHGISWIVIVANWFKKKRGLATSFAMMGGAAGGPAVVVVALLEGWIGWRGTVFWLGLGVLLLGIPMGLVARNRPEDMGLLADGELLPPTDPASVEPKGGHGHRGGGGGTGLTVREAARTRTFWSLVAIMGAVNISQSAVHVHQIAYFEDRGLSSFLAASTVGIAFAVSAIGRLVTGLVMDRLDWRKVMAGIFVVQLIGFTMLIFAQTYWQAVLFAVVSGLAQGAGVPARPILVSSVFGTRHFGSIWGLLNSPIIFAGVLGPIFFGWMFDTRGTYVPALWTVNIVAAAAIPLLFMTRRTRVAQGG